MSICMGMYQDSYTFLEIATSKVQANFPMTFIGFSQPQYFIRELAGKRHLSHTLGQPVRRSRESGFLLGFVLLH